jgi:DNA topoisomerase-1
MTDFAERVAARYKNKKVVDSEKGGKTTIYEYSERQVQNRNREKAERVEKLRKSIGKVRSKVKRDLNSSDPEKMLTALAVALMDHTYERIGNETSAKENEHFGVTGWQRKHVSLGKGKATIRYTGKSGVKQEKVVSDASILKALRNAYEANEDDDAGIFSWEGGKVTAEKVNSYLDQFNITAKDIRGFHANAEMQTRLKAVRSKGGALPEDKKEAKAKLKEEFKEALEETAEAVGHEASTLRSQYLVPGLESTFLKDGTVMEKLKSASESGLPGRVVARYLGEFDPLGE